jgi:signal peptidase I
MYPFIKDGDVITVAPLPPKAPSLGDVLVFIHEQARRLFVHRVTKRDGGFYVTRGDSAHFDDGMISRTNLLGYVTRVERNGKKIRLGLGPERSMIALLARTGLLSPLVFRAWCCMRLFLT